MLHLLWHGLRDALLMAWQVWWALAFGFAISAIVQAWVPRERVERALAGSGVRPVLTATGLGAASSSCSYAAVAIAKSLFEKGASAVAALSFQLASTNLVWELGLVLWVLIGWQFTLGEYVGGLVMIAIVAVALRAFIPARLERSAREHARMAQARHVHHVERVAGVLSWRRRLTSISAWSEVAEYFRGDWTMLYREITVGLLLAGFAAQLSNHFFANLFLNGSAPVMRAVWGAFIGPVIAVLTFVCSVGNVPLAAVLWSGGISFAGVMAFIFADLIVLPIIVIYRKYYGTAFALRISALLLASMFCAALAIDAIFSAAGLVPSGSRPLRSNVFGSVGVNYKLALNAAGAALFVFLFALTTRNLKMGRLRA